MDAFWGVCTWLLGIGESADGRLIPIFFKHDFERTLSDQQKKEIITPRIEELRRTEWQRWVPLMTTYRLFKDVVTRDNFLLQDIQPTYYRTLYELYAIAATLAIPVAATSFF